MNQTAMQNIVLDLEWTAAPVEAAAKGLHREIIEIGAVRVSSDGRMLDEFRCAVRPQFALNISRKVRHLTGLEWSDVADAPSFAEAMELLADWIGARPSRIVTWSTCDRRQLLAECAAKRVAMPAAMTRWLDLQKVFPRVMGVGRPGRRMALHSAMQWCGTELDAACEHTALQDAEHTAELLQMLLTGEYREHKAAINAAGCRVGFVASSTPAGGGSEFGQMAAALGPLYAALMAQQELPKAE